LRRPGEAYVRPGLPDPLVEASISRVIRDSCSFQPYTLFTELMFRGNDCQGVEHEEKATAVHVQALQAITSAV
jgi:hypothetical protein